MVESGRYWRQKKKQKETGVNVMIIIFENFNQLSENNGTFRVIFFCTNGCHLSKKHLFFANNNICP
jgi:hypothetical protein